MESPESRSLVWSHGTLVTHRLGGMTSPVEFRVGSDAHFSPFAEPPWSAGTFPATVPGHVRGLRGIFPCLPFGISTIPNDASPNWRACNGNGNNPMHGAGANGMWNFTAVHQDCVEISFDHAKDDAIATSSQTIRPVPGRPAIAFTYSAKPRRNLQVPFGYHVMLKWEDGMLLDPGSFMHGLCYPGTLDPGLMMTSPGSTFATLDAVPARAGHLCMSQPDWSGPSEDVVMLCGTEGRFSVFYPPQRRRLNISWDAAVMPHCLVWYSRFGLAGEPWRNRYSAIGVEPIAAAFDFLPDVSTQPNPLTRLGVTTSLVLPQDVEFATTLHLEASIA